MKKNEETIKLNEKITELTNDLQRTRADFENYRKQIEAQKANEKKAVKMATVYKFLDLVDNLYRAFDSYKELEPLKKNLDKTMKGLGLEVIATDGGFNPDLHEAIVAEGDGETEVIEEVLRPGYYYEGEVLRPAMVKVKRR